METILACRICLATDVKLYDLCEYRLRNAYDNLTGLQTVMDSLRYVCSYCGTLLNKFTMFRRRCAQSQQILERLLAEYSVITTEHIKAINQSLHNIALPYTTQLIETFDNNFHIKDEPYDDSNIKSDVDISAEEYSTYDVYNNDNIDVKDYLRINGHNDTNTQLSNPDDSDEEPLSIIVQKKRSRKHNKSVGLGKIIYEEDVKSETVGGFNLLVKKITKTKKKVKHKEDIQHKLVILTKEEQLQDILLRKQSSNYMNSLFRCESCYKGFMTEDTYKNHMYRHEPRCGPEVCDICQTRWQDARSLRAHEIMSHERKYVCCICGEVSRTRHRAVEHMKWHGGATFPCQLCGATFERSTSYWTHVRLRHPSAFRCDVCGESFVGQNGLRLHKKRAHLNENSKVTFDSYQCDSCHLQFKNKEAMARHSELSADGGCDSNLFACSQCGDNFESEIVLQEHHKMHQKISAVRTCPQCSRTFVNARSLAAHAVRSHARGRARSLARTHAHRDTNCVCEICGYRCGSKASLVSHHRTHTGEKPFECTLCHKRFSVAQRLQIHMRTHTGERPFPCGECHKAFKHKAALNRHARVHSGVKPYPCPHCGKCFSQSNSMKQHCAGVHMKTYLYSRKPAEKQAS